MLAELLRGEAGGFTEELTEVRRIVYAALHGDVGNRIIGAEEQLLSPRYANIEHEFCQRSAGDCLEFAAELSPAEEHVGSKVCVAYLSVGHLPVYQPGEFVIKFAVALREGCGL